MYCFNYRLKQVQNKDKSLDETFASNKTDPPTNSIKSLTLYNSLVPYIDSDKDDSDDESSLSGEENSKAVIEKIKHSTDQKVFEKKPLVMRPKEDPSDQVPKENTPKKCLVLKPSNDEDINERKQEKELLPNNFNNKHFLPTKKCLVLKPKDEDEPLEDATDCEPVKKCLVRIPKNEDESFNSKISHSVEGKDSGKKIRRRENGFTECENSKSKVRLDNNING